MAARQAAMQESKRLTAYACKSREPQLSMQKYAVRGTWHFQPVRGKQ